jgi:hypothetical protein
MKITWESYNQKEQENPDERNYIWSETMLMSLDQRGFSEQGASKE